MHPLKPLASSLFILAVQTPAFSQEPGVMIGPFQDSGAGFSVALSEDWGVVGGESSATAIRLGTSTDFQLNSPNAEPGGRFGYDVSVSGNLIVVSAPFEDVGAEVDAGRCYLYQYSGLGLQLAATLEEATPKAGARFGHSISVEGQTIAVSSPRSDAFGQENGAVYVFELSATLGVQLVAQLGPDPAGTESFFGTSVSLSDGRLAVGAVYDSVAAVHAGAAYVFSSSSSGLWDQNQRLVAPVVSAGAFFGIAVALEESTLAVGAEGVSNGASGSGSVFVYESNSSGAWALDGELASATPADSGAFGQAVAIANGRVAVSDPNSDAAFLYERDASQGWLPGRTLTSRCSASSEDGFAADVSVNDDLAWVGANTRTHSDICGQSMSCLGAVFEYATGATDRILWEYESDRSRLNSVYGPSGGGLLISPSSVTADPPFGDPHRGAILRDVQWSIEPNSSFDVVLRTTSPEGMWLVVETGGYSDTSTAGYCGDGYIDGYSNRYFGDSSNPLEVGTEVSFSVSGAGLGLSGNHCAGTRGGYMCGSPVGAASQDPIGYFSAGSTSTAGIQAWTAAGASTAYEILSVTPRGLIRETYSATYVFERTTSQVYCTSPANSTGLPGSLMAYGSTSSGSKLLSVRASGLAPGALAILFRGTLASSIPAGSVNVCVAGTVTRIGGLQVATTGTADFDVDLDGLMPGDTAHFQCIHRDPVIAVAGTDAISFLVE